MYSREIFGKNYNFKFGIGFVHDIDKTREVKDESGKAQGLGLTYAIAGLMDGSFDRLADCLMFGNKYADGEKIDRNILHDWIESDECDIERECEDLLDFFAGWKFTRRKVAEMKEAVDRDKQVRDAAFRASLAKAGES